MPTHQDETLPQRYAREHQSYLAQCGTMSAEQVADIQLQLHNALAREAALQARLTVADQRVDDLEQQIAASLKPTPCDHLWTDNGEFEFACSVCGLNIDTSTSEDVIDEANQAAFEAGNTEDGEYILSADDFDQIIANAASAAIFEYVLKNSPAHQSSPAACWTPANHECPGDGVGACKKCPSDPTAKDEHCSTCSSQNGSNYCDCEQE